MRCHYIYIKTIYIKKLNGIPIFSTCFPFIIILLTILSLSSCSGENDKKKISEGEIEYQIEYLDNERDNPFIMLLPRKMITTFNENSSYTLIEGFFGTFKLTYILNSLQQKNYTLLQIMDKKYLYQADINNLAFGYQSMKNIKIDYTNKEKVIAGYKCKHAFASFPGGDCDSISVYYTEDINLLKPNLNNPFKEINGVLMEFSVKLVGINMKFSTQKIRKKEINPKMFEIPNGYTRITLHEMEKIIEEFNLSSGK
jgi:hypothetical protein